MSFQDILTDYAFTAAKDSPDGHISTQLPGRTNGIADAYRHIIGAAEIARKAGETWSGVLGSFNEFGSTDPGSVMDLHNNLIGIHIGNHVRSNNGNWNDVVNLTQEYFGKSLDGFVPGDLTSSNASWDQTSYGNIVLTQNIALDNGLVLQGLSVLDVNQWSVNPKDSNGNELSNASSNWPDANGAWLNNFIPETYNYQGNYSLSTPITILGNGHFTEINGKLTYITNQASGLTHSQIMSHMGSQFSAIANASTNQSVSVFANVPITLNHNGVLKDYHIHIGSTTSDTFDLSDDFHIIEEITTGGTDSITYSGLIGTDGVNVDLGTGNTYIGNVSGQAKDIFTNIENVIGSDNNDTLWGTGVDNELEGRNGADQIRGFQGDDTIDGGEGNNTIEGGAGVDSIIAGAGNDVIYANDSIHHGYGIEDADTDYVDAGAGNDTIYGSGGGDTLVGGADDDNIYSLGNSILKGGTGNDYYEAKKGDVIIDVDGGVVNNINGTYGKEHLWKGSAVFAFSAKGGSLNIHFGGLTSTADNYFTIQNYVNDGRWGFTIADLYYDAANAYIQPGVNGEPEPTNDRYADGSNGGANSQPDAGHSDNNPNSGNPTIFAYDTNEREYGYTNSANFLMVSKGYDTQIDGLQGSIFQWGSGFHDDVAIDSGGSDTVELTNLNSADVELYRNGDDLVIRAATSNEIFTVQDHYLGSSHEIETLQYADGTTLDLSVAAGGASNAAENISGTSNGDTIEALLGNDTISAAAGNDVVFAGRGDDSVLASSGDDSVDGGDGVDFIDGNTGNDTLIGGEGDDTIYGHRGNDTYIWQLGDGNDWLYENTTYVGGTDTLKLTGGITLSELDIYGTDDQSLQVELISTGEVIRLHRQYRDADYTIESITLDDGSTLDLLAGQEWRGGAGNDSLKGSAYGDDMLGSAGNDTLYGIQGNDTLTGGTGDDTLWGYTGDDTYIWQSGDGNDFLYENTTSYGGTDTLKLTGGITLSDLDIYGIDDQSIVVAHTPTGETLTLHRQYRDADYTIESITLDDGSTLDLLAGQEWRGGAGNDSLKGSAYGDDMLGSAGNDTLYGIQGNDTLTGGAGSDTLYGHQGDDTYVWQSGDGNDWLYENTSYVGGDDIILMTGGIVATDVTFSQSGSNLIITHTPTSETLTIQKQYSSDSDFHIETLTFDNGTTVDLLGV